MRSIKEDYQIQMPTTLADALSEESTLALLTTPTKTEDYVLKKTTTADTVICIPEGSPMVRYINKSAARLGLANTDIPEHVQYAAATAFVEASILGNLNSLGRLKQIPKGQLGIVQHVVPGVVDSPMTFWVLHDQDTEGRYILQRAAFPR